MSGENHVLTHDGCSGDAAAYALGALEAAEAEVFERHLQRCVVCAEEVGAFKRVADALAASVPEHAAPSALRSRVIGSVRSELRARGAVFRRALWAPRPIGPRAGRALTALATASAVALAAAVLVIATWVPGGSNEVRVVAATVVDSSGSAHVRLSGGRAELIVRGFAPPPAGLIYEVWLKRPGRAPAPTRVLFSATAQGAGDSGVPAALNGVDEILVTPEPAGGSAVPTHRALIIARLS